MFSVQDLLSGDIVKPRQAPQGGMDGLGTLLGFLSQGQTQMPQLAPMPQSHPVDASAMMHMIAQGKKDEGNDYLATLIGEPGTDKVPTPWKDAHDATGGSGFLGGQMKPMEFMARLAKSPDEHMASTGLAMLNEQFQPRSHTGPSIHSMGAPGQPGYKVNFYMDENNQAVPVGEPYKEGSGVTVNMGEKIPPPSAGYMWKPDLSAQYAIPGGPADPSTRQPTQAEDTATKFGTGMLEAAKRMDTALEDYDIEKSSPKDRAARFLGDGFGDLGSQAANVIKSPARRAFDQSASEFRQFALTAMTGAAYSQDQKDDILRGMIPTDSDDLITRKLKKQARDSFTRVMLQSGMPISKRTPNPDTNQVPEGWSDELEAEFQREKAEGKIK